jgi:hypothetical protein
MNGQGGGASTSPPRPVACGGRGERRSGEPGLLLQRLEPGLRAAALHHHRRGQLMATSAFRESYDGHDLIAPTSNALDFLGRATTSSTDYMGRALRRGVRVNSTPVVLGQELQFATGAKFVVTTGGTTAASAPGVPAVGASVGDGTATLLRQR